MFHADEIAYSGETVIFRAAELSPTVCALRLTSATRRDHCEGGGNRAPSTVPDTHAHVDIDSTRDNVVIESIAHM